MTHTHAHTQSGTGSERKSQDRQWRPDKIHLKSGLLQNTHTLIFHPLLCFMSEYHQNSCPFYASFLVGWQECDSDPSRTNGQKQAWELINNILRYDILFSLSSNICSIGQHAALRVIRLSHRRAPLRHPWATPPTLRTSVLTYLKASDIKR